MPSVEQSCDTALKNMAAVPSTMEMFDKFKPQENGTDNVEKSDSEDSFHLQLDDDDTENQSNASSGKKSALDMPIDETEDEILNKFDTKSNHSDVDLKEEHGLLEDDSTNNDDNIDNRIEAVTNGQLDVSCDVENFEDINAAENIDFTEDPMVDNFTDGELNQEVSESNICSTNKNSDNFEVADFNQETLESNILTEDENVDNYMGSGLNQECSGLSPKVLVEIKQPDGIEQYEDAWENGEFKSLYEIEQNTNNADNTNQQLSDEEKEDFVNACSDFQLEIVDEQMEIEEDNFEVAPTEEPIASIDSGANTDPSADKDLADNSKQANITDVPNENILDEDVDMPMEDSELEGPTELESDFVQDSSLPDNIVSMETEVCEMEEEAEKLLEELIDDEGDSVINNLDEPIENNTLVNEEINNEYTVNNFDDQVIAESGGKVETDLKDIDNDVVQEQISTELQYIDDNPAGEITPIILPEKNMSKEEEPINEQIKNKEPEIINKGMENISEEQEPSINEEESQMILEDMENISEAHDPSINEEPIINREPEMINEDIKNISEEQEPSINEEQFIDKESEMINEDMETQKQFPDELQSIEEVTESEKAPDLLSEDNDANKTESNSPYEDQAITELPLEENISEQLSNDSKESIKDAQTEFETSEDNNAGNLELDEDNFEKNMDNADQILKVNVEENCDIEEKISESEDISQNKDNKSEITEVVDHDSQIINESENCEKTMHTTTKSKNLDNVKNAKEDIEVILSKSDEENDKKHDNNIDKVTLKDVVQISTENQTVQTTAETLPSVEKQEKITDETDISETSQTKNEPFVKPNPPTATVEAENTSDNDESDLLDISMIRDPDEDDACAEETAAEDQLAEDEALAHDEAADDAQDETSSDAQDDAIYVTMDDALGASQDDMQEIEKSDEETNNDILEDHISEAEDRDGNHSACMIDDDVSMDTDDHDQQPHQVKEIADILMDTESHDIISNSAGCVNDAISDVNSKISKVVPDIDIDEIMKDSPDSAKDAGDIDDTTKEGTVINKTKNKVPEVDEIIKDISDVNEILKDRSNVVDLDEIEDTNSSQEVISVQKNKLEDTQKDITEILDDTSNDKQEEKEKEFDKTTVLSSKENIVEKEESLYTKIIADKAPAAEDSTSEKVKESEALLIADADNALSEPPAKATTHTAQNESINIDDSDDSSTQTHKTDSLEKAKDGVMGENLTEKATENVEPVTAKKTKNKEAKRLSNKRTLPSENDVETPGAAKKKRKVAENKTKNATVEPKGKQKASGKSNEKKVSAPESTEKVQTLTAFSKYMQCKRVASKLSRSDLEQFCIQKICETFIAKSSEGELHHTIRKQEKLIEGLRKDMQQLSKQCKDLEIVNKKLMNELRNQNDNKKPLVPLKITRSVGLQVRLSTGNEPNLAAKNRTPRMANNHPPAAAPPIAATPQKQTTTPQKQTTTPQKQTTTPQKQTTTPQSPAARIPAQIQNARVPTPPRGPIRSQSNPSPATPGIRQPTPVPSPQKSPLVTASPTVQNAINSNKLVPSSTLLSQALQNPIIISNPPKRPIVAKRTATPVNARQNRTPTPPVAPSPKSNQPGVIDLTDEDDKKPSATSPALQAGNLRVLNKGMNGAIMGKTVLLNKTVANKGNTVNQVMGVSANNKTAKGGQPGQPTRVSLPQGMRLSPGSVINTTAANGSPQMLYVLPTTMNTKNGQQIAFVNLPTSINGNAVMGKPVQIKPAGPLNRKHPAPLPLPPRLNPDPLLKPVPPKPHLTIKKIETGIILQWKMPYNLDQYEGIASYQLYAYQETNAPPNTDMWRKVGDVKALALPMACTLTQFADKNKYYFAVRSVDVHQRIGAFSDPEEISL